jgi:competence protein ComGC
MTHTLETDDGSLEIYYNDGVVLITKIQGNGFEYLDSLLYAITNRISKPKLVLIPNLNKYGEVIRDNGMLSSRVLLDRKVELYYYGDLSAINDLLYNYYLERDGIEPINNIQFLQTVNSPYKTLNYRMDTIFAI